MKDVFLVYDKSCFYEIVILNYFMQFTNCDVVLCSVNGKPVRTMEGYSVNVDMALKDLDESWIRSLIIPGGDIRNIDSEEVRVLLKEQKSRGKLLAAICAGVDLLDEAGVLCDVESTHSTELDVVNDHKVITARANAYVDFAIEVAKELDLFEDDADLQETIDFWKYHKRME